MYLHILHIINGGPEEKQKVAKAGQMVIVVVAGAHFRFIMSLHSLTSERASNFSRFPVI